MSLQARMLTAGLSAVQCQAIQGQVANNLVATGSVQGTALILGADVNNVTTVASGTGVILSPMNPGDDILVRNSGANALLIYPPIGGSINSLAVNTAYSVATTTPLCFIFALSSGLYFCSQSA